MTTPALPLHQINHVPAALVLPARGNRASLAFSSSGLAHQFPFQLPHQISRQALADMAHRKSLSSLASPDGFKTIGKRLDDGKITFAETTKNHD